MEKIIIVGRYTNVNGVGIAIVASVTKGVDWAAYIGASADINFTEEETIQYTLKYGNKLSEADARYYFPDLYIKQNYRI